MMKATEDPPGADDIFGWRLCGGGVASHPACSLLPRSHGRLRTRAEPSRDALAHGQRAALALLSGGCTLALPVGPKCLEEGA